MVVFGGVFLRAILSLGGCMVEWFHFPLFEQLALASKEKQGAHGTL